MTAPLEGIRIVELMGIGPGPFAGMMLADHGAEVIQVRRPGPVSGYKDINNRSRRSIMVDLKQPEGIDVVKDLCRDADGFIEGYRPGVAERLGLGPEVLHALNPRLVYGRMTGWGQTGPLAQSAGHDLNYIALSGALRGMGRSEDEVPPVPLNLVGDYAGGAMMLVFGMLSAIICAQRTGRGQVVDAAIAEGTAVLASLFYGKGPVVDWQGPRGTHFLSGAAPYYDSYQTADGEYVSIGAIEPQFYALLLEKLGLQDDPDFIHQNDQSCWPAAKQKLTELFNSKTRQQWCELLEGTDSCFAPLLSLHEAPQHPHHQARQSFIEAFGVVQPAPAPRYSESKTRQPELPSAGQDSSDLLRELGYSAETIASLLAQGAVAAASD